MNLTVVTIIVGLFAIWFLTLSWSERRARRIVSEWVKAHGMKASSILKPVLDYGPFSEATFHLGGVHVFRAQVATPAEEKTIWFRVGSFYWGLLNPKIEIKEEPNQSLQRTATSRRL